MTLLMHDTRFRSYGHLLLRGHGGTPLCNIEHEHKIATDTYISTSDLCLLTSSGFQVYVTLPQFACLSNTF